MLVAIRRRRWLLRAAVVNIIPAGADKHRPALPSSDRWRFIFLAVQFRSGRRRAAGPSGQVAGRRWFLSVRHVVLRKSSSAAPGCAAPGQVRSAAVRVRVRLSGSRQGRRRRQSRSSSFYPSGYHQAVSHPGRLQLLRCAGTQQRAAAVGAVVSCQSPSCAAAALPLLYCRRSRTIQAPAVNKQAN